MPSDFPDQDYLGAEVAWESFPLPCGQAGDSSPTRGMQMASLGEHRAGQPPANQPRPWEQAWVCSPRTAACDKLIFLAEFVIHHVFLRKQLHQRHSWKVLSSTSRTQDSTNKSSLPAFHLRSWFFAGLFSWQRRSEITACVYVFTAEQTLWQGCDQACKSLYFEIAELKVCCFPSLSRSPWTHGAGVMRGANCIRMALLGGGMCDLPRTAPSTPCKLLELFSALQSCCFRE